MARNQPDEDKGKDIVRTHDRLYLNENRYRRPRQLHLEVIDAIKKAIGVEPKDAAITICDFGCAAGEFEFALREAFPAATIEGYELLDELVQKARSEVPDVAFHTGSVTDRETAPESHADVSVMVGVLSIFDMFEPILENLIYWTKNGGTVLVHGLFNDWPIDVNIKYNLSADYDRRVLEPGWNIFSKQTVVRWMDKTATIRKFQFHDFNIALDLQPQADPVRSWTLKDADGVRRVTNGLCVIQPHSVLEILVQKSDA